MGRGYAAVPNASSQTEIASPHDSAAYSSASINSSALSFFIVMGTAGFSAARLRRRQ
jgi:hypothetical protein